MVLVGDLASIHERGERARPSQFLHHLQHLVCIDGGVIPTDTIASLTDEAADHAVSHAANELLPRGLTVRAELYTCLGGVVEEFIVADPQGGIPGLVVCPTVVSGGGHVVWFVWYVASIGPLGAGSGGR